MRWQGRRKSDNVEDLRGSGGAGRGLKIGGGVGGLGIVVAILYFLLGGKPGELTQSLQIDQPAATGAGEPLSARDRELGDFISTVLASIEDVWRERFREMGRTYVEPKLVLFSGAVDSACGSAGSSVGPFYCPGDSKVYIDLAFLEDMQRQLRAEGDFAMAYVLAHEVGHHVQNLLGINDQVMAQRGRLSERDFNRLMVRMELQADFLAGIWAHDAGREAGFLESGDIEEGLNAASAVGDDRIMRQTQGYVVPDSFTHGTSEQRARWFRLGLETGDVDRGDTFGAVTL